jgi:peptide/nickel transport system permease protein
MTKQYVGPAIDERAPRATALATLEPRRSAGELAIDLLSGFWKGIWSNGKVTAGSIILGIFILVAIFGPIFAPYDPMKTSSLSLAHPSVQHLLGTTEVGEDIFSQLLYGTRTSLFWGLMTGLLVTILSTVVGLVGGYLGGWVDDVLTIISNVSLVLPAFPLAIVMAAYFPRGPVTICLLITFTNWAWGARVLRAQTLTMRSREFVTAARSTGENAWHIIFFELLPNQIGLIMAGFVSTTIYVILAWAGLEFLGLGDGRIPSWGGILYWAQQGSALASGLWWWFVPPGLCIAVLGAGLSLINFGIDEIADPRLRADSTMRKLRRSLKNKLKAVA